MTCDQCAKWRGNEGAIGKCTEIGEFTAAGFECRFYEPRTPAHTAPKGAGTDGDIDKAIAKVRRKLGTRVSIQRVQNTLRCRWGWAAEVTEEMRRRGIIG